MRVFDNGSVKHALVKIQNMTPGLGEMFVWSHIYISAREFRFRLFIPDMIFSDFDKFMTKEFV